MCSSDLLCALEQVCVTASVCHSKCVSELKLGSDSHRRGSVMYGPRRRDQLTIKLQRFSVAVVATASREWRASERPLITRLPPLPSRIWNQLDMSGANERGLMGFPRASEGRLLLC